MDIGWGGGGSMNKNSVTQYLNDRFTETACYNYCLGREITGC